MSSPRMRICPIVIGLCPLLGLTKLLRVMLGSINFLSSDFSSRNGLCLFSLSNTCAMSGVGDLPSYTWSLSESECDWLTRSLMSYLSSRGISASYRASASLSMLNFMRFFLASRAAGFLTCGLRLPAFFCSYSFWKRGAAISETGSRFGSLFPGGFIAPLHSL